MRLSSHNNDRLHLVALVSIQITYIDVFFKDLVIGIFNFCVWKLVEEATAMRFLIS